MGSQQCRRVFFSLKKLKLSCFVYTQFWLNLVMDDDQHFDYITKLEKKTLTKNILRSFWLPSESWIFFWVYSSYAPSKYEHDLSSTDSQRGICCSCTCFLED
jgi:hypothetical protein